MKPGYAQQQQIVRIDAKDGTHGGTRVNCAVLNTYVHVRASKLPKMRLFLVCRGTVRMLIIVISM